MIIASGTSNRQTKALASSVRDAVREAGFGKPRIEGEENGEWIIVDCGAAVAHIMQPAIRQYYHLEEIWGDKPVRTKLGSSKPASPAKVVEEKKPAAKQPTTLRRSSAAKTAIRAAELEAKAAKGPSRKAPARKASAKTPVKVFGKPTAKKAAAKSAPRSATKPAAKTAAAVKKPARKAAPKTS